MATGTVKTDVAPPPNAGGELVYRQIRATQRYVKWIELGSSLMLMAAIVIGFLLTMVFVDHWLFSLGTIGRTLAFLTLVGGLGTYFVFVVVPYLRKPINPLYAAQTIERSTPSLKNSLINFLFLRNQVAGVHRVVLDAVEQRAAADVQDIRVDTTVDRTKIFRVGYALIGLTAVGLVYAIFSPQDPLQSVYRIALPWADIDRPTFTRILAVDPGDVTITQGKNVTVKVTVSRNDQDVALLVSAKDGSFVDRVVPLKDPTASGEGYVYSEALIHSDDGIQQSLFYRVRAGDALSPEYQVRVNIAPIIEVKRLTYEFPLYTRRPKVVLEARGDVRALEGTRVTVEAAANEPIQQAYIELINGKKVAATVPMQTQGKQASGRFTLELLSVDNGKRYQSKFEKYRVRFKNRAGVTNEVGLDYGIDVLRDLPPMVQILEPKSHKVEVPEDGEQNIEVRAVDPDFGLTQVKLSGQRGDLTVLDQVLWTDLAGQLGQIVSTFRFSPSKLKLVAGDQVVVRAVATDNKENPANVSRTEVYVFNITAPSKRKSSKDEGRLNNNPGKPLDPKQGNQKKPQPPNGNPSQSKDSQKNQGNKKQQQKKQDPGQKGKKDQQGGSGSGGGGKGNPQEGQQKGDQKGGQPQKSTGQDKSEEGSKQGGGGQPGDDGQKKQGGQPNKGDQTGQKKQGSQQQGGGGNEKTQPSQGAKNSQTPGAKKSAGQPNGQAGQEPNEDEHIGDKLDRVLKHRQQNQGGKNAQGQGQKPDQQDKNQGQPAGNRRGKTNENKDDSGTGSSRLTDPMGRKKAEGTQQAGKKGANTKSKAQESEPGRGNKKDPKKDGPQGASQKNQRNTQGESENRGGGKKQQSDTGNSGSPMGRKQDAQKDAKADGQKGQDQQKKGGGGTPTQPGAGQKSDENQGAAGGEDKLQDKKKTQQPDNQGRKSGDKQSTTQGQKKSTDSKGDSSGDRAGGGGRSKGQNANSGGNDSAGGNRSSDRGSGASPEAGQGDLSQGGGKQQVASSKTGQKGTQKGEGTFNRQGKKGQRSNSKRKNSRQSPNQKQGSGGAPRGGGRPADRPPEKFDNRPRKPIKQNRENVEFAKQQTNLALEHLKKQLNNARALKDMKLSKDDAKSILDYFSKLKKQSNTAQGKAKLNDVFRSLGFRPRSFNRRAGSSRSDKARGNVQGGRSGGPPAAYRELWNASRTRTK